MDSAGTRQRLRPSVITLIANASPITTRKVFLNISILKISLGKLLIRETRCIASLSMFCECALRF